MPPLENGMLTALWTVAASNEGGWNYSTGVARLPGSFHQPPPLGQGEVGGRRSSREVAGCRLCIHLDLGVGGDQVLGDRHLLDDLDALLAQRVRLHVAHRGEA